jgi:hypothetical protein
MAIAKITGTGLISIAVLVACLWGCLIAEHRILIESQRRQTREMLQLRHLRDTRFTVPASLPANRSTPVRPVAG